jgi:poly(beta-D-mannuronate) lyase
MITFNAAAGAALAGVIGLSAVTATAARAELKVPFEIARHVVDVPGEKDCESKLVQPVRELELFSMYDQDDDSRSTIDPEQKKKYEKAMKQARDFLTDLTKQASNYTQTDGNRLEQAACALKVLNLWADADALSVLKTRQSALSASRLIAGAAMAYMQVRPAAKVLDIKTDGIEAWLARRARDLIPVYTESGDARSNLQNHRYWGGFAVAAVGVAVGNRDFLEFGVESYRIGVCQVTADGALPLELDRRKKARDYHLHAVAPLVMIASLAQPNGFDLFSECDNALPRLVRFSLASIKDPSRIEALAGEKQVPLPMEDGVVRGDRLAWLSVYLHYFPNERGKYKSLIKEPLFSSNLGGRVSVIYDLSQRN